MGGIQVIPDHLLELIFLHVRSPISLIRTASTCKRWRRIVANSGFLRRYGCIHGLPLIAGAYYDRRGRGLSFYPLPREPPPTFVASPVMPLEGRHFSLDFLWEEENMFRLSPSWRIADSRGSHLLLSSLYHEDQDRWRLDMVLCEPLTRRYKIIRRLAWSAEYTADYRFQDGPFLLHGTTDGAESGRGRGIDLSTFRVMCLLYARRRGRYCSAMLTSSSRRHHRSWRICSINRERMQFMGLTKDSLYWHAGGRTVVALDRGTAEFTSSLLPGTVDWYCHRTMVTVGSDGEERIVASRANGILSIFGRSQGGEWAAEKSIQLRTAARGLPGYKPSYFLEPSWIYVTDTAAIMVCPSGARWVFRLDMETLEVELLPTKDALDVKFPCEVPWPPALHACTDLLDV